MQKIRSEEEIQEIDFEKVTTKFDSSGVSPACSCTCTAISFVSN